MLTFGRVRMVVTGVLFLVPYLLYMSGQPDAVSRRPAATDAVVSAPHVEESTALETRQNAQTELIRYSCPGMQFGCEGIRKFLRPVQSWSNKRCQHFQFVHVGSTGGTVFSLWAAQSNLSCLFTNPENRPHPFTHTRLAPYYLELLPADTCFVLFVRDVVDRWRSGFFMAAGKRKFPWVFDTFATANDLAEALSAEDQERRRLAKQAHETLEHLHKGFAFYLPDFEKLLDRVLYVGLTCNMKQDVAKLLRAVGIPDGIAACMPELKAEDTISASKTATYMSELAVQNVQKIMQPDYQIIVARPFLDNRFALSP